MKILSKKVCSTWLVTLLVILSFASSVIASTLWFAVPLLDYDGQNPASPAYDSGSRSAFDSIRDYDRISVLPVGERQTTKAEARPILGNFAGLVAAETGANSAIQAQNLARQLTSEEQVAQALAGKGEPIFGAGTSEPLTSANRLAQQYGGNPADWAKMGGENSAVHGVTTPAGNNFEIHWYQDMKTGQIVELKTKVAGH